VSTFLSKLESFVSIGAFLESRLWHLVGKSLLILRWLKIFGKVGPRLIILVSALREIWVISPTEIVGLRIWIVGGPCEGCIHMFGQHLMSKVNRTLFGHMVHTLTVSAACSWGLCWADLVYRKWVFSF